MLFNSYGFLFVFLPVTLAVAWFLGARGAARTTIGWLTVCSLFFYGWWKPVYVPLLLFSMVFNFSVGRVLGRSTRPRRRVLLAGVAVNLGLLGWFKYANFFAGQVSLLLPQPLPLPPIVLPLAISFFTFQQIAYLCDAYEGRASEYRFLDYCLFVSFFPQLIAGPIVHHGEMMPQFRERPIRFRAGDAATGISIFIIGLFKKVVFADNLARFATPVFAAAAEGASPTFFEAWGGALAYTGQIYFDFSGYSDMAIGLGWMLGIRIPVNFNAPYRAANIIDFWRRWHITLSRFLRDYLYIPLGGNRLGRIRRYTNLMVTMLLGGLWHGAGWTFVLWGGLHGLYLMVNHGWRQLGRRRGWSAPGAGLRSLYAAITFVAVVVGWVFFRAEALAPALAILEGMAGLHGVSVSDNLQQPLAGLARLGLQFNDMGAFESDGLTWILPALLVAWFFPSTQRFMGREGWFDPKERVLPLRWSAGWVCAGALALMAVLSLTRLQEVSEFLYFQF